MAKRVVNYSRKHVIELTDDGLERLKMLFECGDQLADELITKERSLSEADRIELSEKWDTLVSPFREVFEENQ